jgi:nucleoside-diphosphate-sugar epimerase
MKLAAWGVQRLTGSRLITPQIVADTFAFKFFSSAKAERELGWKATTPFTQTLSEAWDYYTREGLITLPGGMVEAKTCPP